MVKTKEELLKALGVVADYNAHGGIVPDTKDVILIEVLIDLRDTFDGIRNQLATLINERIGFV